MDMMVHGLGLQLVPGIAAVIEQRVGVVEDPIGEPVIAHVLISTSSNNAWHHPLGWL
jgi:hypothetical protein